MKIPYQKIIWTVQPAIQATIVRELVKYLCPRLRAARMFEITALSPKWIRKNSE